MSAKHVLTLLLLCVFLASGCSYTTNVSMYPVQGPAAALAPPVVYQLTIKGNFVIVGRGSGKPKVPPITAVLGNGETFQGNWINVSETSVNQKTLGTAASLPPQPNLAFAWDAVYGQGFFVAHLLGTSVAQATMTGSHGTVLQAELLGNRGVAIDSKGNVYKMIW
ncbi:MAG: hypothetical protein WBP85_04445 [Terracidiphilus sp.]